MTKDSVTARLQKLLAHARSAEAIGNTVEAAAFAAKIEELLVRNELEMSDIELSETKDEDPIVEMRFEPGQNDLKSRGRRVDWQEALGDCLARGFFCRLLVSPGGNRVWFVGRRSHVQIATYVYQRLCRECIAIQDHEEHALWLKVKREQGLPAAREAVRGWKRSFRNGFVSAIGRRLWEAEKARREQLQTEGNGTALVRIQDMHTAVKQYLEAKGVRGTAPDLQGGGVNNARGYIAGQAAGGRASLAADGVGGGSGGGPRSLGSGR